ncbi:hypothetical protein PHBOTO_005065 [Pseudozyma hubeiensis]|nr:hypothetical protein PHBOTO_005065 [Pseudozyma hubeiensis]
MEPALPLPLRLDLTLPPHPTDHTTVSSHISSFLSSYASRTGTSNSTSNPDEGSSTTGGIVAAQLTRLMNGLSGRIDYDAFESLISGLNQTSNDDTTPAEVLEEEEGAVEAEGTQGAESFSKHDELSSHTPNIDDSLRQDPMDNSEESPRKKHKKDKKDKKERKEKKLKKESLP